MYKIFLYIELFSGWFLSPRKPWGAAPRLNVFRSQAHVGNSSKATNFVMRVNINRFPQVFLNVLRCFPFYPGNLYLGMNIMRQISH